MSTETLTARARELASAEYTIEDMKEAASILEEVSARALIARLLAQVRYAKAALLTDEYARAISDAVALFPPGHSMSPGTAAARIRALLTTANEKETT